MTVSGFLVSLADKFDAAGAPETARECRDYAMIALHQEAEYEEFHPPPAAKQGQTDKSPAPRRLTEQLAARRPQRSRRVP